MNINERYIVLICVGCSGRHWPENESHGRQMEYDNGKRIEDDTTVVSIKWKMTFFESSTCNESSRVQVNGEGSGVLQTVENCHIAF